MLQPDPQDRPVSMAEIARMTRDEDEATTPPTSRTPRDRPALPRTGETFAADSRIQTQPSMPKGPQQQRVQVGNASSSMCARAFVRTAAFAGRRPSTRGHGGCA